MKQIIFWQNPKISWNWFGIRLHHLKDIYSLYYLLIPIVNTSHNCQRSIGLNFLKYRLEIIYYRAGYFNQDRKLFMRKRLWKLYQLFL